MSQFDAVALARARDVIAAARLALRPPPRLTLSQWADEKFYLSVESSAEPGRWRTLPYQREIMDSMTDPRVREVVLMKSARVGWTKMLNALVGYHVEHDPCPILLIQPDEESAKRHVKDEIEPMLRDCPVVGERFVRSRNGSEKLLYKKFRGGVLHTASSRSPNNFRAVSRRRIIGDEVEAWPPSVGKEGDVYRLALRRGAYYWNWHGDWGSTPVLEGGRIQQLFFGGDQRRRYVPCPFCHAAQVLVFANLKWPPGQPELATFQCINCERRIDHAHARWMDARGEWRPGPHLQFPDDPKPGLTAGRRSYHIWAAYSYAPNTTWPSIAVEFVQAKGEGLEKLQTVINTVLGETWKDKGEAPKWRRLYDRREAYHTGTCPAGVRFLTAGVDVQQNRLVYEVVGWGRGKESWSIEIGVIPGDTSDLTAKGPWFALDALLERTFTHDDGAEIRIRLLAVDSGDQTQFVYNWARNQDRVMVIKGSDSADVLVSTPKKVDVTLSGKRVGTVLLWRVGKPISVSTVYGWLKQALPTDQERAEGAGVPLGYCHFPQYDEEFFKQLTALQLITTKNPQGFLVRHWAMVDGREDHYLDARRYAHAAAVLVGLDRFKDKDWRLLEQALKEIAEQQAAAPVEDASTESTVTDTPTAPSTPAPRPQRPRRIGRSKYLR